MVLTLPWKLTISLTFFSSTLSSPWKLTLVRILYPEETRNRWIIPRKRSTGNTKMGTFSKICVSVPLLPLSSTSVHLNSALRFWVGLGLCKSISGLPSRSLLHQQGVPEGTYKARGLLLPAPASITPRSSSSVCRSPACLHTPRSSRITLSEWCQHRQSSALSSRVWVPALWASSCDNPNLSLLLSQL